MYIIENDHQYLEVTLSNSKLQDIGDHFSSFYLNFAEKGVMSCYRVGASGKGGGNVREKERPLQAFTTPVPG